MKITSPEFSAIAAKRNLRFIKHCTIELIPHDGSLKYFPQRNFDNVKGYPLLKGITMDTPFCKFKPDLPKGKGVYLWVVEEEIIYLGEAEDLRSRFNSGYGNISPRNPYLGGQSANVKMNRAALEILESGKQIDIHYALVEDHKGAEAYLLSRINTKYNVQNN